MAALREALASSESLLPTACGECISSSGGCCWACLSVAGSRSSRTRSWPNTPRAVASAASIAFSSWRVRRMTRSTNTSCGGVVDKAARFDKRDDSVTHAAFTVKTGREKNWCEEMAVTSSRQSA